MNVNNPEDFKKYKALYFTHQGYETFENHLKNLVKLYIETTDYPFEVKAFLGIPLFDYVVNINSHQELLGRIKILANMLGIKDFTLNTDDNKTVNFNLNTGEFIIR